MLYIWFNEIIYYIFLCNFFKFGWNKSEGLRSSEIINIEIIIVLFWIVNDINKGLV